MNSMDTGSFNRSYAGTDIIPTITPYGGSPVTFGEIQTISYSIFRPTNPVHSLGRINANGMVRGHRTIAGSIIFTVFDRHMVRQVLKSYEGRRNTMGLSATELSNLKNGMLADEMMPFDISITFANEYGKNSYMTLYGVRLLSEGQTMSIEDMMTENTMQYTATGIDLMRRHDEE